MRDRLADKDEEGSIAAMGALSPDDAALVLQRTDLRALAVKAFNDNEMARAITSLKGGRLLHKLQWLKAEDSNLGLVWPLIVDPHTPAAEKRELFLHGDMRDFFVDLCGDDEMASVVDVLGGWLEAKLNWMFEEGTSIAAVNARIAAAPPAERTALYAFDYMRDNFKDLLNVGEMAMMVDRLGGTLDQKLAWMASKGTNGGLVFPKVRVAPTPELAGVTPKTRAAVRRELSRGDFRRFEQMLDQGLLRWEEISKSVSEKHYEQASGGGWQLKDFGWKSRYEITYTRTELRITVRIKFKGQPATPAHRAIWRNGIINRWNGHWHLEGARRLAIVFDPVFVDDDEHQKVELQQVQAGVAMREDMTHWYAGPNVATAPPSQDTTDADAAAHEFGHMVGLEDEYRLTRADFERIVGRPATAADQDANIGYSGSLLMRWGGSDVDQRDLTSFLAWLNAHRLAGEAAFRLVAGP